MAWSEVFTDVPWANGDYLTETKLDQMVANDRYLRDQVSIGYVLSVDRGYNWDPESDSYQVSYPAGRTHTSNNLFKVGVAIGGVKYSERASYFGTGSGDHSEADVDISALAEGLHDITVGIGISGGALSGWDGKIVKTQEMEKMTVWIDAGGTTYTDDLGDTEYRAYITRFWLIFHRETKAWV